MNLLVDDTQLICAAQFLRHFVKTQMYDAFCYNILPRLLPESFEPSAAKV
jgi:hypothetical protein